MQIFKQIVLLIVCLFPVGVMAQKTTFSGYVSDRNTGEKLIFANVYVLGEEIGTATNSYGYFSLTILDRDSICLVFSYLGYRSDTILIQDVQNHVLDVKLVSGTVLDEVVVMGHNEMPINKRLETGIVNIPIAQIKKLPALGGESDLLKVMQLMPGVQSGQEGKSGMYVRGGSPDQNLILLDGVPLYYVNHIGGFVSTFNSDAINQVKMTKGGFPASHGGRLSSVLDVRMKDGNSNEFHGSGMLGMVTSKLSLEGPIKKNTSSYLVSYRRFLYDWILRPLSRNGMDDQQLGYNFYDFNAKINYRLSSKDQLFLSIYSGRDNICITDEPGSDDEVDFTNKWGNNLAALRWNHVFSPKHFSNYQLAYTRYNYNVGIGDNLAGEDPDDFYYNYDSGIDDFSLGANFEYKPSPIFSIKYGLLCIRHHLTPSVVSLSLGDDYYSNIGTSSNSNLVAWDNAVYIENHIQFCKSLKGNFGLRYSNYLFEQELFHFVEPRILLSLSVWDNSAFRVAYDKMHQNVHLLTSNGVGIPVDIWFPATATIVPETSEQVSASFVRNLRNVNMELSVEGFYRKMDDLIEYKEGYSHLSNVQNWEENIESKGTGTVYGVEFLLQKKYDRFSGWIAYTWSKNMRQFDDVNLGKSYPYRYDRRHDFSLVLNYQLNEEISFSANWVYGTGNAFTPPCGMYYTPTDGYYLDDNVEGEMSYDSQAYIYADRNSSRMRDYHRLDISAQFTKKKKWGVRTWSLGIYNVYNRKNPYYYNVEWVDDLDIYGVPITGRKKMKISQKSLFPFIPSFSYSFSF